MGNDTRVIRIIRGDFQWNLVAKNIESWYNGDTVEDVLALAPGVARALIEAMREKALGEYQEC